jgi:conjugal transfer/type IV secretion protein DotA/TraY
MRLLAFIFMALIPGFAFAEVLNLTPPASDITVTNFLSALFGDLVGVSGGSNPMALVIGKFNAVVLLVGGILLAYTLIGGTMQTAHDGEMLGKKWSSMWTPIRTSLGVAAIVPMGSGYCVIQYVVMWLVMQGVGAADVIWSEYADRSDPLAEIAIMQNNSRGAQMADLLLQQNLCTTVINWELYRASLASDGGAAMAADIGYIGPVEPLSAPPSPTSTFEKNVCGSFEMPSVALTNNETLQTWFGQTFDQAAFSSAITRAHTNAYRKLDRDMGWLAYKIYKDDVYNSMSPAGQQTRGNEFKTAVNEYNKTINDAARAAADSVSRDNDVARYASRDGWGMAGAWYMKYVYVQTALNQEISRYPDVIPPNLGAIPPEFKDIYTSFLGRYNVIKRSGKFTSELGIETMLSDTKNPVNSTESSSGDSLKKYLNDSYGSVLSAPKKYLQSTIGNKNPVLASKDFGDYVFTSTITGTLGLAVLATILPGSSVMVVLPIIFALVGGLMGFSAMLAFYLPMAPFIIWFGVVIGWVVLVIEAVIAAPMWAVAHLHPDGDGIVGRGGQGYSLILGLTLRPALAVLGLIAAMVLIVPVGHFFNRTYWAVFEISQGNSVQGLFTFVACIAIFSVVYVSIIHRVFALIHVIPDQILRWIGGASSDLGSYAGDLGNAGKASASAIGGVAGGLAGQSLQSGQQYQRLKAERNTANEARMGKEAQQEGNAIAQFSAMQNGDKEHGRGMGAAMMAGDSAAKAYANNPENKPKLTGNATNDDAENTRFLKGMGNAREEAEMKAFNKHHEDPTAWGAAQEYKKERSKRGMGDPTGAEMNYFTDSRASINAAQNGSFSVNKFVDQQQVRAGGMATPPVTTVKPAPVAGNVIK